MYSQLRCPSLRCAFRFICRSTEGLCWNSSLVHLLALRGLTICGPGAARFLHTASLFSFLSLPSIRSARRCSLRAVRAFLSQMNHRTLLETGAVWASVSFSDINVFCICFQSLVINDLAHCRLVGGFLTLSPDYGFVLEDEEGVCGYAMGTVDVKPFVKKCKLSWIPFMQEKYIKPDAEKDLSEAEVSMSFFIHHCLANKKKKTCFSLI